MSVTVGIYIYAIVMSLLLLFAIFSNILVIYCVAKFKKLRTVTNVLICNLAVSDIFLAGFVMPQRLHDLFHEEDYHEGEFLCKVVNFSPIFIITSSIYTLVCVSFERHRAIIGSHGHQVTFRMIFILIPVIWVFSLLVSIPTLIEYSVNNITVFDGSKHTTQLSCGSQQKSRDFSISNAIFVNIVSYIIPVIILFRNYIQVAIYVWKKGRNIQNKSGPTGHDLTSLLRFKSTIQLVKLLVAVAVIFAVSWLPFYIILLYAKVTGNDASENATGFINLLLVALAIFSTVYNVVLYVIFNPSFKRAIKGVLRCVQVAGLQDQQHTNEQRPGTSYLPTEGGGIYM